VNENNQSFFQNRQCPYFPCHTGGDEGSFNCLFCYCPLYALGEECGGNCTYTQNGIKDCSGCQLPHREGGYEYVLSKFPQLARLAKQKNQ
jgi:Zn-finger protein